ncbi:MAG TPA: type II toxin-antitoxin system HicB family antitoxin [Polyangiaceae bacterium]
MKRFVAELTPDADGAWNVTVPQLEGCFTWGRSLSEARRNVREAIEVSIDGKNAAKIAAEAEIVEIYRLPETSREALEAAKTLRRSLDVLRSKTHAQEVRAAAVLTRESALSLRDTGELLGLSQEGVRKLLRNAPKRLPRNVSKSSSRGRDRRPH